MIIIIKRIKQENKEKKNEEKLKAEIKKWKPRKKNKKKICKIKKRRFKLFYKKRYGNKIEDFLKKKIIKKYQLKNCS